jgi:hypothetical protein
VKLTPTALNSLRSLPPQFGQTVRLSSVNSWWMSKAVSHTVQR